MHIAQEDRGARNMLKLNGVDEVSQDNRYLFACPVGLHAYLGRKMYISDLYLMAIAQICNAYEDSRIIHSFIVFRPRP